MSDRTARAVQDAIEAHVADEFDGAVLRGFVLNTISQTIEDALVDSRDGSSARGCWLVHEGQLVPMSIGLAHELVGLFDRLHFTEGDPE